MATTSVLERSEGGTFIPASQRPDGTWRKPRRIKEGYVPQEEVPLYESRGKQWAKSRSAYPVGLDPEVIKASEQKLAGKTNAAASKKKKKGASTQPVPNPGAFDDYDPPQQQHQLVEKSTTQLTPNTLVNNNNNNNKTITGGKKQQDSSLSVQCKKDTGNNGGKKSVEIEQQQKQQATEPAKRLRNLRKKLRDIENLEQKIKSKELKNPDKDQIEKVSRKEGVQAEILALELELSMSMNTS